ncbi:MAG: aminopeptidase P family protein [Verrucomicrobia bacterium]|nr:aminopeptidase P family protein [Verrucomicrobiota bacterium]
MDPDIRVRLTAWLGQQDLGAALLASPFSVDWASGHESAIETGPNPFAGGPSLLLVTATEATLLRPDCEAPDPVALRLRSLPYVSYTPAGPLAPGAAFLEKFRELVAPVKPGELGVEFASLPAPCASLLAGARPIDGKLSALRAVKTPAEIDALRAALALCDHAQAVLPGLVRPGRSELEIWGDLRAAVESRAGRRLPILADFVSGPRTAEIGGPPTARVLADGDWLLADIVPRLGNYWGDICGVAPAGTAGPRFAELRRLVGGALDHAISLVRPGAIPEEIDAATRTFLEQRGHPAHPHHTGHGIGVSYHEEPRIVAGNRTPLEPGMVIALEPGVYLPREGGVRLEDVVLVTARGAEVLTRHRHAHR